MNSDLISRQAAIDAVDAIDTSIIPFPKAREYAEIGLNAVKDILWGLPSEPEQKTGKWRLKEDWNGDEIYECPFCESLWTLADGGTPKDNDYNYCPCCGARME